MLTIFPSIRVLFVLFLTVTSSLFAALPAKANNKYAAIVIHADTGDVLFSRYATHKRYPASLTKMMTLYLLFEEIESGRLTQQDTLKVSRRAAAQPASKLNARAGSRITVEQAIQALIIKSANDIAVTVAESLGGNEATFARRMTRKARQLGMYRTTFRNASGLPNYKQVSTARDLALLSQRLIQDFPQYRAYFRQTSFRYLGKTYTSHNRLLRQYKGANGLKTGYTRRSGYNLATSVQRGDHLLIGVVLGGRSGTTRDRHMKTILTNTFASIRKNPKRIKASHLRRPVPALKPNLLQKLGGQWPPAQQPKDNAQSGISESTHHRMAEELNLQALATARVSTKDHPDHIVEEDPVTSPLVIRNWSVQLGAYTQRELAQRALERHKHMIPRAITMHQREISITQKGRNSMFRARFTNLTQKEATHICSIMHKKSERCIPLQAQ